MVILGDGIIVAEFLAAGNFRAFRASRSFYFSNTGVVMLEDCEDGLVGPSQDKLG